MNIESKEEKIKFLEKILKMAKENPSIIGKSGVEIFDADSHHVQEKCSIGLELDGNGNSYFTINGTYAKNNNMITNPETLLLAGDRYLPSDINKFKQEFHLFRDYKNQTHDTDLINSLR
jgi:hypothetical protein